MLSCCALMIAAAAAASVRTEAVLARHRAETAADLAALAAATRIGLGADSCSRGRAIAAAAGATLRRCVLATAPDGRSGTVVITVRLSVDLPVLGARTVVASARAGRLPAATP